MQRIGTLLNQTTELSALTNHAESLVTSQKIWAAIVPEPLSHMTQAGAVKHKRLTVYAENGAVAAKIKLLLPSLLTELQKRGVEVTSIRVEVQVKSIPRKPEKPLRSISLQTASRLGTLADKLSGSELGEVLSRLSSRT